MPTRFKYREVEANDYGLTTQEILFARDTTLKQFVSLKKMAPYNEQGEYNAGSKKRRKFREMLKHDLEESLPQEKMESQETNDGDIAKETEPKKKRRRLKKGKKKTKDISLSSAGESALKNAQENPAELGKKSLVNDEVENSKETKKRRRKKSGRKETSSNNETSGKTPVEKLDYNGMKSCEKNVKIGESDRNHHSKLVSPSKEEKQKRKKRKKKRLNDKKGSIEGISNSRLASYGL